MKDASAKLKINYSTAKTILRVFRNENRIERKYQYSGVSTEEELTENYEEVQDNRNFVERSETFDNDVKECSNDEKEEKREATVGELYGNIAEAYDKFSFENLQTLQAKIESLARLNFEGEKVPILKELILLEQQVEDVNHLMSRNSKSLRLAIDIFYDKYFKGL